MSKTLHQVDWKIIAALRENPLKTNVQLAQEVGVTEGTIRKRLSALIEDDYIKVVVTLGDPKRLGYEVDTYIGIEAEMTQVNEVARQLAELPQVTYVGIVSGVYNIIAHALLHTMDELLDFMTNKIATIQGIRKTETSHVLKVVKRSYFWVSEDQRGSEDHENSRAEIAVENRP